MYWFGVYLFAFWHVNCNQCTIVPGPKHPFTNKLLGKLSHFSSRVPKEYYTTLPLSRLFVGVILWAGVYVFTFWYVYCNLCTIVPGLKHPLANKILGKFFPYPHWGVLTSRVPSLMLLLLVYLILCIISAAMPSYSH